MLYNKFANTHVCTVKYTANDEHYAVARELAAELVNRLVQAVNLGNAAQVAAEKDPANEIKAVLAEQAWDQVIGLQDLTAANPNACEFLAEYGLESMLEGTVS